MLVKLSNIVSFIETMYLLILKIVYINNNEFSINQKIVSWCYGLQSFLNQAVGI